MSHSRCWHYQRPRFALAVPSAPEDAAFAVEGPEVALEVPAGVERPGAHETTKSAVLRHSSRPKTKRNGEKKEEGGPNQ